MTLLNNIKTQILNPIILLFLGVALLIFLYSLVIFFLEKDSASSNRKELYNRMIWGVIGLAIMVSVFGIMQFIVSTISTFVGG